MPFPFWVLYTPLSYILSFPNQCFFSISFAGPFLSSFHSHAFAYSRCLINTFLIKLHCLWKISFRFTRRLTHRRQGLRVCQTAVSRNLSQIKFLVLDSIFYTMGPSLAGNSCPVDVHHCSAVATPGEQIIYIGCAMWVCPIQKTL